MMRAANSYQEACAIMRMVEYGERVHRQALRLTARAVLRHDSQWLRDMVKRDDKQVSLVVPARLVDGGV